MGRREEYRRYLRGDGWRNLSMLARFRAGNRCELCGAHGDHVHHIKYPQRWKEDHVDNLIVVCEFHHSMLHGVRGEEMSGEMMMVSGVEMSTSREDSDIAATRGKVSGPKPGCGIHIMLDLSPDALAKRADQHAFSPWQLRTPLTRYALAGVPYGLDNGCFSGRLPDAWPRLLEEARRNPPLWACSPDVVGSARRTMELWPRFARQMNGVPRALVLQDGIGDFEIPWHELAAVFIGGSDAFKKSPEARAAATAARMLGKWVHVGRVNTAARALEWIDIADSIDGSGISRDPRDEQLAAVLRAISGDSAQASLFGDSA